MGKVVGPRKPNGRTTFQIVFGAFDEQERQVVHIRGDGKEVPVVLLSYPIEDDSPLIIQ